MTQKTNSFAINPRVYALLLELGGFVCSVACLFVCFEMITTNSRCQRKFQCGIVSDPIRSV